MRHARSIAMLSLACVAAATASGADLYNNLTPNDLMAVASRPDSTSGFEIEAGDDFVLGTRSSVTSASFIGLIVNPPGVTGTISEIDAEIYRVFPLDSAVGRTSGPPTFSTPQVPTRVNSPSDVALDSRDSAMSGQLSFTSTVLTGTFSALNSIQPGGIHPLPGVSTGGDGPITGQEVEIDVTFTSPFDLAAGHYFFVPQVLLSDGAQFEWLSASRPISGAGTTPINPDLQAWTRDANLEPDWLRVGADIVGGATPPTFNLAFKLDGTSSVPEPGPLGLLAIGMLGLITARRHRRAA
jgi:hypothetical protein